MDKNKNREIIDALRPHFIFNVMNMLRYMIKKDGTLAQQMTYDLSLFLRGNITAVTEEKVAFQEEWTAVEAYFRLERVSHPGLTLKTEPLKIPGNMQVSAGSLMKAAEVLVKEQVRTTKEPRTLEVDFVHGADKDGIRMRIEETKASYEVLFL